MVYVPCKFAKFFIFNPLKFGLREENDFEKIIYFTPPGLTLGEQMMDVGLCEALITLPRTFTSDPTTSCATERFRYVLYGPEEGWWLVLRCVISWTLLHLLDAYRQVVENAKNVDIQENPDKSKKPIENIVWLPDEADEIALSNLLQNSYNEFRLFHGPLNDVFKTRPENVMRREISLAFEELVSRVRPDLSTLISTLRAAHLPPPRSTSPSLLDVTLSLAYALVPVHLHVHLSAHRPGIQYLPVDKNVYLAIQSFINLCETSLDGVRASIFMFQHYLVWSGFQQRDTRIIYRWMVRQLASLADVSDGFIYGPVDPSVKQTEFNAPQIFPLEDDEEGQAFLVLFKLRDCLCLFSVDEAVVGRLPFYLQLQTLILKHVNFLAPILAEHAKKITPFTQFKYIYFNRMNLAMKHSILKGNALPADLVRVLDRIHTDFESVKTLDEVLVGTYADGWVAARKSDQRELYIVFDQKNANLLEVNDEVRRLSMTYFRDVFID